ncbi:glycine-rich RNA-binding protein 3, mitochondrial-like [Iris pallida]|uniref:Glycine-rich RNA-binding protein 3, mitochondrial-like n=1 Tax=Iris pallida TaxID=29817 RepID=A0AAX6F7T0_IRIPA|nr:glycine-rich RNA-binding protein 3, mitochondrial-like [Iris pallida]
MDPMGEEQLDYGDDDFASPRFPHPSAAAAAAIPAVADEENDDDDFDDLYNDVNVGESFAHVVPRKPDPNPVHDPHPHPLGNGSGLPRPQNPNPNPKVEPPPPATPSFSIPVFGAEQNPNPNPRVPEQSGFRPPPVGRPGLPADPGGPTMLFVGELHWWTTDAEIESAMSRYGRVKEVKFFDERASGKSKGYCQVEFYDAMSAAACKGAMDGYQFNGRACVVAFASPQTLRQMGASHVNRNQAQSQQGRRQMNDGMGRGGGGGGWWVAVVMVVGGVSVGVVGGVDEEGVRE